MFIRDIDDDTFCDTRKGKIQINNGQESDKKSEKIK